MGGLFGQLPQKTDKCRLIQTGIQPIFMTYCFLYVKFRQDQVGNWNFTKVKPIFAAT